MVAINRDISEQEIQRFRRGITLLASSAAELAADVLAELGLEDAAKEHGLPTQFALELGAVVILVRWEHAGYRSSLPDYLPTAKEAATDMWSRIRRSPSDYVAGTSGIDLVEKLLRAWRECFAPDGAEHLGEDVLLSNQLVEDPMEAIADFLWQFRHLAEN